MSSDYYHGMVRVLKLVMNVGVIGIATASMEGAGFQSLNMIMDGGAGSNS